MDTTPIAIQNHWSAVLDHSRRYQEFTYIYPVISRRSRGLSIGVNLNPDKRCNFDCVYCEVDRRTPGKASTVDLEVAESELRWLIQHAREGGLALEPKFSEVAELSIVPRDIAFSGDGEPTMVPNFDACVAMAAKVKREFGLTNTKLVLISDAAGLDKASVKLGLRLLDENNGEIWGKLDAGSETYYHQVNRSFVSLSRILKNLTETARERPIVIQSLFLKMHGDAMPTGELMAYCSRLNEILKSGGQIREVHAYTVARPTPEPWATRLSADELENMSSVIRQETGLPVHCFD